MIEDENGDKIEYKEKDLVWAKVKGYPWWPSIIGHISFHNIQSNGENIKEKIYSIELIGEKNNNIKVSKEKIEPFMKNYDKYSNTKNPTLLKSIELAKKFTEKQINKKIFFLKENNQDKNNKKDKDMNISNSQNLSTKKKQESCDEKSSEEKEKENEKTIKYLQKKRLNERVILDDNDEENNINNLDNKNKEDKKLISSPKNNIKINININLTTNNQNMVNINSFHPSDVLTQKNSINQNIISNVNYSNLSANEQNAIISKNNQNNNLNDFINYDEESIISSIEKDKNKEGKKDSLKNEEKNEKNKSCIELSEEENESEEDNDNNEVIITNDEIKEIIKTLLNCQIQISNISSQKTIILELNKLSDKLNELFAKNQDLEIYNLTKDLIPILITFTYNKNNDILVKSSEILSFLNEKIINEIFNLSQKEYNNLLDSFKDNNNKDQDKEKEINLDDNEDKDYKEGLNLIELINKKNVNKSNISEHQHTFYSKRGRPKKISINSEISSDFFSSKLGDCIYNIKDNFNLNEKNIYDEFMKIISCKDKDKMHNDFKELSSNFFNNIYDKNNNDLDTEIAKIRKKLCLKIYKMVHKFFPEINSDFLKKVIVYFEYKIRNDNTNIDKIYSNKINSLFEIIKERLYDKTK